MPHDWWTQDLQLDGINSQHKIFGCRDSSAGYVSDRLAALTIPESSANLVTRESAACASHVRQRDAIVNHVCWIGSHYIDSTGQIELYVEGMERIEMHERALLYRPRGNEEVPNAIFMPG